MPELLHTYFCSISPTDTRRAAANLRTLSQQKMSGAMVQALYDLEDLLLNGPGILGGPDSDIGRCRGCYDLEFTHDTTCEHFTTDCGPGVPASGERPETAEEPQPLSSESVERIGKFFGEERVRDMAETYGVQASTQKAATDERT